MDFLDKDLVAYIESHTENAPELLSLLDRETYANIYMPRMLSGHLQGRILAMIANMVRPKTILEIGTFTGYSAIALAEGLEENGKIITIDINEELEDIVRSYIAKANLENVIDYRVGNAINIIPEIDDELDLVFIDADKSNYSNYFDLVFDKVKKGGFIIADNVLWSGKVLEKNRKKIDKDTSSILKFNKKVHEDVRVENVLFPVRDGLMVLRKK
ncbi:MAG: O-methyltransferase [Cyclobacteriaceae bacterium]|nr:O-methyltransferase [Cyclobacteriaceae bacterium]